MQFLHAWIQTIDKNFSIPVLSPLSYYPNHIVSSKNILYSTLKNKKKK